MAAGEAVTSVATLTIRGVVQGVGFRPFVARLARAYGLTGQVRNEGGQVRVIAYGEAGVLREFRKAVEENAPQASSIVSLGMRLSVLPAGETAPVAFVIARSSRAEGLSMPTPDIAVCGDCLRELAEEGNPRYRNPFISCTHCGPRFTILRGLPYDRQNTSMDRFPLCALCGAQYEDPDDRRCHAQTVCCNQCGPTLRWRGREAAAKATGEAALESAVRALRAGGIVAIKGVGGYHLACDAMDSSAVSALRVLKGRESKPFAVMFRSMETLQEHCEADEPERALLIGPERPIVLLKRRAGSGIAKEVYGTSPNLGAFLPYAPLQALLLEEISPLVMTSANVTGLPIVIDDSEALRFPAEHGQCEGVLYHDRAIVRRVDDSVAMAVNGQTVLLRRARGYVPLSIPFSGEGGPKVLSLGAQQKSSICLSAGGQTYPSAEIGDLSSEETMAVYRETVGAMHALLNIVPDVAVCDLHPGYDSARFAAETGLPIMKVQHHFAHIASVLAETNRRGPVIGVAFDGTGYGPDGTVWGGEFLLTSATEYTRVGHIRAIPFLGGDASVRQGWKSAVCLLADAVMLRADDDPRYPALLAALGGGLNVIRSSSMGRVFDGVSSLLNICHDSGYEGQCAIELENAAAAAEPLNPLDSFPFDLYKDADGMLQIDHAPCVRALISRLDAGERKETLALCFHQTICRMIVEACLRLRERYGLRTVALSGGVFQNRILLTQTLRALESAGFEVLINRAVPPNDGGVSLGQAYIARHMQAK
jgi:hydrogenase maturation protein HypF